MAIGNEMVNTVDDPRPAPPALLGMDLVRLGLERAASAEEALDVMTGLLERHGQGGVGDAVNDIAYWSSFLIADRASAWVLETSERSWAARPVERGDAISNRLTLRRDWTRSSSDVAAGTDLDTWRDPAHADRIRRRPSRRQPGVRAAHPRRSAVGLAFRRRRVPRWHICETTAAARGARRGATDRSSQHPRRYRPTARV